MACNKVLQAEDKPTPRTCADCGLGPCRKYPQVPVRPATAKDLASLILSMNYGTLNAVASDLAAANADKDCRPKLETPQEFAELLFDWAEAQQ